MTIDVRNIYEKTNPEEKFNFELGTNYSETLKNNIPNMMRPMPFSGYPFQGKLIQTLCGCESIP